MAKIKMSEEERKVRRAEANRKWREKNLVEINARKKAKKEADPERFKAYAKKWRDNNPDYASNYYQENKEALNLYRKDWSRKNPEKEALYRKNWEQMNPGYKSPNKKAQDKRYYESNKERIMFRVLEWRRENPAHALHYCRMYQLAKRTQMPVWADRHAIKKIYLMAKEMTEKTGIPHHVDHIVPINGENVSGLHWEGNMQILEASENIRKSNRVPEECLTEKGRDALR